MRRDSLGEMDSESDVEPDGDSVGTRSVSQGTGYLHMDSRFSDKRRRGTQDDDRLVTGQNGVMESPQKASPNECGHFSV